MGQKSTSLKFRDISVGEKEVHGGGDADADASGNFAETLADAAVDATVDAEAVDGADAEGEEEVVGEVGGVDGEVDGDATDVGGEGVGGGSPAEFLVSLARRGANTATLEAAAKAVNEAGALLEVGAPARPVLTSSLAHAKKLKPPIPTGLGSPPFPEAGVVPPSEEPASECMRQWNALGAVPEAWAIVAGASGDASVPGSTWDPMTACRCLSLCPYSSIDALAVEETCGGVFDARSPAHAGAGLLAGLAAAAAPAPGLSAAERAKEVDTGASQVV